MVQWAKNYVWGAKFNFLRPKLSINLKYIYIIIIFFKPWGALGQYMAPSLVPFSPTWSKGVFGRVDFTTTTTTKTKRRENFLEGV